MLCYEISNNSSQAVPRRPFQELISGYIYINEGTGVFFFLERVKVAKKSTL